MLPRFLTAASVLTPKCMTLSPTLQRFTAFSPAALQAFKADGALIWNKPVCLPPEKLGYYRWFPDAETLYQSPSPAFYEDAVQFPSDFVHFLKKICQSNNISGSWGVEGPVHRHIRPMSRGEADSPHVDDASGKSLAIIIPLTKFTTKNGATRVILGSHTDDNSDRVVSFTGPCFHPLLLHGNTTHYQNHNQTMQTRSALQIILDSGAFLE